MAQSLSPLHAIKIQQCHALLFQIAPFLLLWLSCDYVPQSLDLTPKLLRLRAAFCRLLLDFFLLNDVFNTV